MAAPDRESPAPLEVPATGNQALTHVLRDAGEWAAPRAEHPALAEHPAADLSGPGFGDEAAAGLMLAPPESDLEWQNAGIEGRIRQWHDVVN